METKVCSKCKKELPVSEFWKNKSLKSGLDSRCRFCKGAEQKKYYYAHQQEMRDKVKKWHEEHKEQDYIKGKLYREQHREELNEKKKAYRKNNAKKIKMYAEAHREEQRTYRELHKSEIKKYQQTYRENNKDKLKEYYKTKYKTDIQYKLKSDYLHLTARVIRNKKATPKEMEILGCDYQTLKKHLETKFDKNMNWDNYGVNGWHIDHIIPITSFDLTDMEQVKKCFNYRNTQPLWAKDNREKSDKITNRLSAVDIKAGEVFL